MNQEKVTKSIKENKGILRQLTSLNNEVKQLKGRIRKLEKAEKDILRTSFEGVEIPVAVMSDKQIANIKVGGTD